MRVLCTIVLLLVAGTASADSLTFVEDAVNPCAEYGCMYYEWRVDGMPDIRYIVSGYEDGIDYSFYRMNDDGERKLLLRVNPIVVDETGKYWWGYPWATTGMVLTKTGGQVLLNATTNHDIIRDGNTLIPEWQRKLPALLLTGKKGKWNIEQKAFRYEAMSLEELVSAAKKEK